MFAHGYYMLIWIHILGEKVELMKKRINRNLAAMLMLIGIISFFPVINANAKTDEENEIRRNQLLIEFSSSRKILSSNISTSEVETREEISPQVELWSLSTNANIQKVRKQLLEDPSISHVESNYERKLFTTSNDPYIENQWWVPHVRPQTIWASVNTQKKNTVVAVIDSGVAIDHEDLKERIQPGGYNFYSNNTNVTDVNGHGTMVSGVIAAASGNGIGISGMTGAYNTKVLPIKVSHLTGTSYLSDIVQAIDFATSAKVDVINLSLGGSQYSAIENAAIQRAIQAGITVVAAAGNEALEGNPFSYPASYDHVISVGAVNRQNKRASFSNYNPYVTLVAPGTDIFTTTLDNSYKSVSGTSFSSPIVAGAVAMAKSLNPNITTDQMESLLENTATDLGVNGKDSHYGAGLLNLENVHSQLAPPSVYVPANRIELDTNALIIDLEQPHKQTSIEPADLNKLEDMRNQKALDFEREPNNSFSSANSLVPGDSMVGTITDYYFDLDYYRFTLDSTGSFALLANWIENSYINDRDNKYLSIGIYNSKQDLIDVGRLETLSDGTKAIFYSSTLLKGTYYLGVLQSSPYDYLFTNESYMITTLFKPDNTPTPEPEPKPVFSFEKAFLEVGQDKPFVTNIESTGKLSSSNPAVATINSTGTVHAVGYGTTTIRYASATTTIEVQVKVAKKSNQAKTALFEKVLPVNATDKTVTWVSSDPTIAEVDTHGIIIGKKGGTAVISVKTNDGGLTSSATVTVVGNENESDFVGDFPEMTVNQDKVFTITFSKDLQKGKDYTQDISISRLPHDKNRITTFTAKVDEASPNKLYITPTSKWSEGIHYLRISKQLQNKNSISLSKDIKMKFDVIDNFDVNDIQGVKQYKRLLNEFR